MSKEEITEKCKIKKKPLELLHTIAFNIELMGITCFGDELRIIEQALQRLEAIENSNPSEALECWNYIKAIIPEWARKKDEKHPDILEPIKQDLLKAQEQEKVLDVIKNKQVNVRRAIILRENYQDYIENYGRPFAHCEQLLTEEEFELLKRYCDEIK